jgi:hypothetical protein
MQLSGKEESVPWAITAALLPGASGYVCSSRTDGGSAIRPRSPIQHIWFRLNSFAPENRDNDSGSFGPKRAVMQETYQIVPTLYF